MKWLDEEVEYLKDNYASFTTREIGEVLGRNQKSVESKDKYIGLKLSKEEMYQRQIKHLNKIFGDQNSKNNHNWKGVFLRISIATSLFKKNVFHRSIPQERLLRQQSEPVDWKNNLVFSVGK